MDQDLALSVMQTFGKHTVSLGWIDAEPDAKGRPLDKPRKFCVSGFIMSFDGQWVLLTAGHILKGIDSVLEAGRQLHSCVLIDSFGDKVSHRQPFPFAYEDAPKFYIDDDDLGIDFGFIVLRDMYKKLLEANGVTPLDERVWRNHPPADRMHYVLFGFPTQFIITDQEKTPTGVKHHTHINPVTLIVQKIDGIPDCADKRKKDRFYGRLSENLVLTDIDGMSGAPLFGYMLDVQMRLRYWLVGVQGGWYRDSKVIYACPTQLFCPFVAERLKNHVAD
jgi:hypothetical protein